MSKFVLTITEGKNKSTKVFADSAKELNDKIPSKFKKEPTKKEGE